MKVRLPSTVRHKINKKAREVSEFEDNEICHNFSFFKHSKINGKVYGRRKLGTDQDSWTEKQLTDTYLEQVFYDKTADAGDCDVIKFLQEIAEKAGKYYAIRAGSFKRLGEQDIVSANSKLLRLHQDLIQGQISAPNPIPNHAEIDSCAFYSLASALLALHDEVAAARIRENITKSLKRNAFVFAMELLRNKEHKYSPTMHKYGRLKILTNRSPFPTNGFQSKSRSLCNSDWRHHI